MGWWHINKFGGISKTPPTGACEGTPIGNAIPGRDSPEDHYGGDDPADIMDATLRRLADCWQKAWGRPPYIEELEGVFTFCIGPHREAGKYKR